MGRSSFAYIGRLQWVYAARDSSIIPTTRCMCIVMFSTSVYMRYFFIHRGEFFQTSHGGGGSLVRTNAILIIESYSSFEMIGSIHFTAPCIIFIFMAVFDNGGDFSIKLLVFTNLLV